jgi:dolichol-phosphate mannosyltransferase
MHRYLPALFLTYGHETAYVPVNDRVRVAGKSKYNNIGRALIGIYDLVGVSWLRKRTKVPAVVEDLPEGRQVSDISGRLRRHDGAKRSAGDLP